jgi:ER membrane protein complex subunit 2
MSLHNDSEPSRILHLSQKAPSVLASAAPAIQTFPLTLLGKSESAATWADYESLFHACLTAGDDKSAYICLEKLTQRFGATNNRIMGLRGVYQEATANGPADLENVLRSYETILQEDPMNVVCGLKGP